MKQEILSHKRAYLILILGLIALTVGFLGVWPDKLLQRAVILSLSLFYLTWGVLTHIHSDRITRRVVSEYLAMSLLAGTILILITI